ncbi:hypothetical protein JD276_14270 [Leucobacter sp. CSA1]|uniref:Dicarboxylate carrier MatC N-terminal domain-containing protein n=1 Tax=Leucobacter chromiisoli TaxID=2796471 RepID=A0A934UWR9_9MICO|nr:SLC13 family permease [Leucobacter chromiisoli]MBK0420197.1 hypothetical protein [Leucobacter chromiisoli]
MTLEAISIVVLAAMFVVGTWREVNMGLLGFVAAAGLGLLGLGLDLDASLAGFPIDLFVTLVGLTYLFGFAQNNGAIDVLVHWCVKLVRGRVTAAPWIFFFLTAALIAFGALFAVAIIAPLALRFARRNGLNTFMTGLLVVHGALAGAFSPISVYGVFINDYLTRNGFESTPLVLFLAPFGFNLLFAAVVWLVIRHRPGPVAADDAGAGADGATAGSGAGVGSGPGSGATLTATAAAPVAKLTAFQLVTLIGLAAMAVSVIGFGADIGIVSISIGALLAALRPADGKAALAKVSWPIVVLITGVLSYIYVLEQAGTVAWVSDGIMGLGVPLLAALLLFYLAGVVSALASSLGIIGVVIGLAGPFLASGDVHVGGFVAALAIAATIVDISPFSTNGAMLLANVDAGVRDRYYRKMLGYAGLMCLIGPGLAWLVVAVPTWLS